MTENPPEGGRERIPTADTASQPRAVIPVVSPDSIQVRTAPVEEIRWSNHSLDPLEPKSDRELREAQRDNVAKTLAYCMLALFAITVLSPITRWLFSGVASPDMVSYVKDVASIETAILAGIIGFYFSATRI